MDHRSAPRSLLAALLTAVLVACGPDTVELPAGTTLAVELQERVDPAEVEAGSEISARLAGDLTADGRVLLPAGTVVRGRVTAVQQATRRLPAAVALEFPTLETNGAAHSVATRITSAEASTSADADSAAAPASKGLPGTIAEGRQHAPMMGPELSKAGGTAVLLGTEARPAHLPEGGRLELELTGPVEVVPPQAGD